MMITINDHRKVSSVQRAFSRLFPNLWIEFYTGPRLPGTSKQQRELDRHVGAFRRTHRDGKLTLHPGMTVDELKQQFSDMFDLKVHLFRRSGHGWVETMLSGDWSLAKQNKEGARVCEYSLYA